MVQAGANLGERNGNGGGANDDRVHLIQNQLDEVTDIMKNNITKAYTNLGVLEELEANASELESNTVLLSRKAKENRFKAWFLEKKLQLGICCILSTVLLLIISGLIVTATHHEFLGIGGKAKAKANTE